MPSELSGAAVSHVAQDGCAVMRRTCYEMFKPLLGEAMKTIDAVVLTSGDPIEGVAAARPCWHERVGVHAQGFHAAHLREVGGQLRGQIRREERPHQRRSYGASYLAEGVEGFPEGSIFYVFPALKRRAALYFCPWGALSLPLCFLRLRGFRQETFPRVSGPLVDAATTKYLHSATSAIIEQKTNPIREFHQKASHENHPERRAVALRRR